MQGGLRVMCFDGKLMMPVSKAKYGIARYRSQGSQNTIWNCKLTNIRNIEVQKAEILWDKILKWQSVR